MDNRPLKSSKESSNPSGTVDRAASQAELTVSPHTPLNSTPVQHQPRFTMDSLRKQTAGSSGRKSHKLSMLPPPTPLPAGGSDDITSSAIPFPSDNDTSQTYNLSRANKRSAESFIADSEGLKRRRKSSGNSSNASVNNDDATIDRKNKSNFPRRPNLLTKSTLAQAQSQDQIQADSSRAPTLGFTPTSTSSTKPRSLIKATGLVHGGSAAGPSTVALSSKTTSNSSAKPPSSSSSTSSKPSVSKASSTSTPTVPSSERARQGLKHLLSSAAKLKASSNPTRPSSPSSTNTIKSKVASIPASASGFTSIAALTLGTRSSSSINLDPPVRTSSSSLSKPAATPTPAPVIVNTVAGGLESVPTGSPTHTNTDIHQDRMLSQKSSLASISPSRRTPSRRTPSRRTISSSSSSSVVVAASFTTTAAATATATESTKEKLPSPKKTPSISGSSKPIASSLSRTPSPSKWSSRAKFTFADLNTKTSGSPGGRESDDEDELDGGRGDDDEEFDVLVQPTEGRNRWQTSFLGDLRIPPFKAARRKPVTITSLEGEGEGVPEPENKPESSRGVGDEKKSQRKKELGKGESGTTSDGEEGLVNVTLFRRSPGKKLRNFIISSPDISGDEHGKGKSSPRKGEGKGKAKKTHVDLDTDSTENNVQINSPETDVEMVDVTSSTLTPAAPASASVTAPTPTLEPQPLPITPSRSIESMTPGRYNALIAMESAASARLSGMASPSLSRSASGSGSGSVLNLAAPLTSSSLDRMQQQQEQQQKELEKQGHKQEEMFKQQQEMMASLKEQQEMFSRFEISHREFVDRLEVSQKQWLDKLETLQDERLLSQETRLLSGLETIHQRKLAEFERGQEEHLSGLETRQDAFFARVEALQGGLEGRLVDGLNVRLKDSVGLTDRELGVQMTLLKESQKEAQKEMEERFIGTFEDWNGRHEAKLSVIQTKGMALVDWVKGQIDGMGRSAEASRREVDEQRKAEVEQRRKDMEEMENARIVKREEEEHRLTENILRMFTEEKEGRRAREEKEDGRWRVFEERWRVAGEREEKRDEEVRALKRTLDAMSEREKAASVDAKKDIKDVGRALGILAERVENVGRDVGVALSVLGVEPSAKEKDPRVIDGDANMEVGGSQESPIVIDGDGGDVNEVNARGEGGETYAERGRKRRRLANGDAVSPLVDESQGGNANAKPQKSVLARLENMEMDLQECLERLTDPMAAGAGDLNLTFQDAEKHDSLDVDPTKDQAQQGPSQDGGAESHTDNEDIQITTKQVVRHEMGVSPIRGNAANDRDALKAAKFPEDLAKEIKDILLRTLLENGIVVSKTDRAEQGARPRRNERPNEDVFGTVTVNATPETQMGPDEGGSFGDQGMGRVEGKGKGKERIKDVGVNTRDVGGTGVRDDEEGSEASRRRGEDREGDGQRNDQEKRVDPSGEDIVMHDHSVASSSCTARKDESRARGRSHTRKPRASNPDFVKGTLANSGFSPVDWSKPRVESSREGARMLSLSPHAKLILSPPMTKGSGRGVGSISPSPSIYGSMRNGAGSPANALLKSRSSSFSGRSPNPVSRTYTLPPQREGSIAALRQVVLGTPFPDKAVFEGSRNVGASGGMDVDADAAKEANDLESESESGGANREKVLSDLQPTDDESAPMSAQSPGVRAHENGNPPIPDPVQTSGPEIGRTSSSLSWSSLSTLTSIPSSSSMSSRSESPEKAVSTSASVIPSNRQSGNVPSTLASTSSSGHTRVIDLKTIKFGPPKKKKLIGASPTPTKTSFAVPGPVSRAKHVSPSKKSSPKVSTPTPAQRSEQAPSSQTPIVLSQSSQTTVDEESIAQDLIMTASTEDFEQEDIEQFSSLVRPSVDDDISVGTSLGTHAVGIDSQSQIESAHDTTPGRQRVDQDDLEDDRASPVPCSPPMLKKPNVSEQSDAQTPKSARHNDDQHFDSPEPPSQFQSQPADHPPSPSPEPFQPERSPSHPSDITNEIVQAKRELNSAAPMEVEVEDERTSLPVKHTQQPSSSTQRPSVVDDKKGKGKSMERNSVLAEDVISISSDSDIDIIETTQPKFKGKGKGKEKEKTTPAPSEPAPSQQKPRPKPVPTKRKASTKLNVIEKPPPEVVDLTTPVKQPPKAKPKGKGNDGGSNVQQLVVAEPELEPEPEPEQVQQPTRRPAAAKKGKPATPLAVKKYTARLAADEDSDEADIIPVKQKKPPPQASTSSAAGSAVKNEPAEESGSLPPEAGAGGKTRLMGILAGKAKQSAAMTRVVKRKRTPEPENADDDTVVVQEPPLKRAKARMGSTTSTSTSVTEKAKEAKSKPPSKVKTGSQKGKEKEDESGNRYPLRSPRKDPSIGGISNASVSTPKKKKTPVVWPKVENPNFVTFVNCDMCDKWYHIGCVGVEPGDRRLRDTEVYCCPLCQAGLAKEDSPIKSPNKTHQEVIANPPKSRPARCSRRGCLHSKELEETFIVEAFIGRHQKVVGGQGITYEYLVKWLNYSYAESTWETIQGMGMADPTKLLERFERATADDGIDLENAPGEVVLLKAAAEAGWTEDKVFVPKA